MANVTSRKNLILVVASIILSLNSYAQKKDKLTVFSNDFSRYLVELEGFLIANDNAKLKLISKKLL